MDQSGGFWFGEPLTDDRDGFVWVLVGEFADLLDRLGVDLTLDLRDVDHRGRSCWRLRCSDPEVRSCSVERCAVFSFG